MIAPIMAVQPHDRRDLVAAAGRYVLTVDPPWQRRRKPGNEIAGPVWTTYLEFVTLWDWLREASLGD